MHVGQPKIAAGVAVRQLGVVDAHQVQNRGVVIVYVARVADDIHAVLIGLPISHAALDAGARQQARERLDIVVATLVVRRIAPRRPAELRADRN